jgi:hypothetical protein
MTIDVSMTLLALSKLATGKDVIKFIGGIDCHGYTVKSIVLKPSPYPYSDWELEYTELSGLTKTERRSKYTLVKDLHPLGLIIERDGQAVAKYDIADSGVYNDIFKRS